jgi:hypothetical protein
MSDQDDENPIPGSCGTPGAGGAGTAGPCSRGTREDPNRSGTGPANEELAWARRNVKEEPVPEPVREVFRKTALHDTPPPEDDGLRKLRGEMLARLRRKRPENLYMPFEAAFRDFIASLLALQYREEEKLREQIARLLRQAGELQDELEKKIVRIDRRLELLEERGRYP